jgi:hypothetical protein
MRKNVHTPVKKQKQLKKQRGKARATADGPPAVAPTPEQVVEQLRVLLGVIPDVPALTQQERELLRNRTRIPDTVMQASINILGTSGKIEGAVGQPAGEVRQLVDDANRWDVVVSELKGLQQGISDANLVRRQRASLIATQVYGVGRNLALDPENAELRPHVEEIKRLKRIARGRKAPASTPNTPASDTPSSDKK